MSIPFLFVWVAMTIPRFLIKDLADCKSDQISGIAVEMLVDQRPFHLKGSFPGPEGTPYEGGHFEVDIVLPDGYPMGPPKMKFLTNVYHPNICFGSGAICLNILMNEWTPALRLRTTLISIQSYLSSPDLDDPLNAEVAKQYITNRDGFNDTAAYWTQIHAGGPGPRAPLTLEENGEDPPRAKGSNVVDFLRRIL